MSSSTAAAGAVRCRSEFEPKLRLALSEASAGRSRVAGPVRAPCASATGRRAPASGVEEGAEDANSPAIEVRGASCAGPRV